MAIKPRTTAVIGGTGLILVGLIWGLGVFHVRVPVLFASQAPTIGVALLLFVAMAILAIGWRREAGIGGISVVGRIALIVFGARSLLLALFDLTSSAGESTPALFVVSDVLTVVFVIAALVAAIAVANVALLKGVARWVLFVVAACFAIATLPTLVNPAEVTGFVTALGVQLLMPASILVLGIVYSLSGLSSRSD